MGSELKAMVLAAGYGKRARPLSLVRPKPLFPIIGRPMLGLVMDRLKAAGVKEVVVNTHHLADQIIDYLAWLENGIKMDILLEDEILGTGGGVKNAESFLNGGHFFLINADVVTNVDLTAAANTHVSSGAMATLVLHDHQLFNQVAVSEDGRILGFRNRYLDDTPVHRVLSFTGIHVVNPEVFQRLPEGFGDIITVYQAMIEEGLLIKAHIPDKPAWWDGGTLESYIELHRDLLAGRPEGPFHVDPSARVADDVKMFGCVSICSGACVRSGARLENSILWPGAVVANGVSISHSVLADNSLATTDLENIAWVSPK